MTDTATDSGDINPNLLYNSRLAREALFAKPPRRETLARWIAADEFPAADKVVNGLNYWYGRTLIAYRDGQVAA